MQSIKSNIVLLNSNWTLFKSSPNQHQSPCEFNWSDQKLISTSVPSTVAMAINGQSPDCWHPENDYDHFDWWYRVTIGDLGRDNRFPDSDCPLLCFDGLATLCEVWLNKEPILTSNNMFRGYSVKLAQNLKPGDQLTLVFRSISNFLKEKKPKPRWKTKLVENQQMRWIRSTVLGHVSVWTPPIKAIGPWRKIYLQYLENFKISHKSITPWVEKNIAKLDLSLTLEFCDQPIGIDSAQLIIGDLSYPIDLNVNKEQIELKASFSLPEISLWWPHSHGEPSLHPYKIQFETNAGTVLTDAGTLGFKSIQFVDNGMKTAFRINDETIFCRGTCWSVSDYLSLNAGEDELRKMLTLMTGAGINMIRVGGTMVYESDDFYRLCDELGILVWQDFMFASMDYPVEDPDFLENILEEAHYQLARLSRHNCITVYCGNTDVEAQAAMFGMPKEIWSNRFFSQTLKKLCHDLHARIPYIASSPSGGALPFHLSHGVSHYWGIGAYMKPVDDQNKQRVLFASEGMGLSHIPEDELIHNAIGKSTSFPYSKEWSSRIPKDLGAGWDFDAIRDHYLEDIFEVDARILRRQDPERFISLSRVATGEAISQVFKFWRSKQSICNGGLIWFNRDFWPCAGFGLIDSNNQPKAALYQLKQVWRNVQVLVSNNGLDGAEATIINETSGNLKTVLQIELLKNNSTSIAKIEKTVKLIKHSSKSFSVDELLGTFYDTGFAYRFGPCHFDTLVCRLVNSAGVLLSDDFLFPNSNKLQIINNSDFDEQQINVIAKKIDSETIVLTFLSDYFLQYLRISVRGYIADENYFHLSPRQTKKVILKRQAESARKFRGYIEALNLKNPIKIIPV